MGKSFNKKILLTALIILITALTVFVLVPTSAAASTSLAFADSTLQGSHEVIIIAANGTTLWEGNSSATATLTSDQLPDNGTIIIHLRPEAKNILESPGTILDEISMQIENHLIELIFIVIIGLALFRKQ